MKAEPQELRHCTTIAHSCTVPVPAAAGAVHLNDVCVLSAPFVCVKPPQKLCARDLPSEAGATLPTIGEEKLPGGLLPPKTPKTKPR